LKSARLTIVLLVILMTAASCSRQRYRLRADRDAYSLIGQKTSCAPWQQPGFSIQTAPDSRLSHNGCIDDPPLPDPSPSLYEFQVPETPLRPSSRFFDGTSTSLIQLSADRNASNLNRASSSSNESNYSIVRIPDLPEAAEFALETQLEIQSGIQLVDYVDDFTGGFQVANASLPLQPPGENPPPEPTPADTASTDSVDTLDADAAKAMLDALGQNRQGRRIVPIGGDAWSSIPPSCVMRAIEFESIRDEYQRTYEKEVGEDLFDGSEKLALEDLLQLAVKHSREYQTAKELLYRASLRLSLERYAFQLKFTPTGNGTNLDWRETNTGGLSENSLTPAQSVAVDKVLATGGNLLARFANDVLLTFNGPSGFASDIGSELLTEITQPLLQRDIVFERLTQAERDVVYAARTYARFRKQFFRDIAGEYYNLLLTYRSIEIDMLDYFSNQRAFDEGKAKFDADRLPRFQVDQFEQNALNSRSSVIRSCNSLEESFDRLKLRLGIPPETPINLDLRELELITARDEVMVASELSGRLLRYLDPDSETEKVQTVRAAIQLANKLKDLLEIQAKLESKRADESDDEPDEQNELGATLDEVQSMLDKLQVEDVAIQASASLEALRKELNAARPPLPTKLIYMRLNHIRALLELGRLQKETYGIGPEFEQLIDFQRRLDAASTEINEVRERADELLATENNERLRTELARNREIADSLGGLLREVEAVVPIQERLESVSIVADALELGESLLSQDVGGLAPIDIDVDDAMLTALVSRFDLMNERGVLADTWRQIKLAGDDLRSILNLRASYAIRTDPTNDNPFDFTSAESDTRVGVTLDLPLNRRAQRNAYRIALIDYNVAMRNLMQLEDEIKFGIRNNLRALQLDREQYAIAVASAALASDRRNGTRLELQLEIVSRGRITARDFLEAQAAYTASLNSVARAHIDYILDRIDLFLDLELLQVDEENFWPQLYDESYQPERRMFPPAGTGPAFGGLPKRVWYSDCIRRMDCIPFGAPRIYANTPPQ